MPEPSAGNATSKKLEPTQIQVSPRIFTDLERASTILYCLTSKFGSLRQRHWNHQHRHQHHHHQVQGQVDANPVKSLNWRPPTDLCLDSFCSAFGKNRKDTARTVCITSGAFEHYRESWIHIDNHQHTQPVQERVETARRLQAPVSVSAAGTCR